MNDTFFPSPRVIREDSHGFFLCDIRDEMLSRRELECTGPINGEMVYSLTRQIRHLQREDPNGEIIMYINSPGGEVQSGLALYDVMKGVSCPIRTVCLGLAASMAAVLFAAGDHRDILPHGSVMIHDPLLTGGLGGSALQVQEISRSLMRTREDLCTILAKHTGKSIEDIYAKTRADSYFTAQEAVDFGLADRIVDTI